MEAAGIADFYQPGNRLQFQPLGDQSSQVWESGSCSVPHALQPGHTGVGDVQSGQRVGHAAPIISGQTADIGDTGAAQVQLFQSAHVGQRAEMGVVDAGVAAQVQGLQAGQPSQTAGIADAGIAQIQTGQAGEGLQRAGADGVAAGALVRHIQRGDGGEAVGNLRERRLSHCLLVTFRQPIHIVLRLLIVVDSRDERVPARLIVALQFCFQRIKCSLSVGQIVCHTGSIGGRRKIAAVTKLCLDGGQIGSIGGCPGEGTAGQVPCVIRGGKAVLLRDTGQAGDGFQRQILCGQGFQGREGGRGRRISAPDALQLGHAGVGDVQSGQRVGHAVGVGDIFISFGQTADVGDAGAAQVQLFQIAHAGQRTEICIVDAPIVTEVQGLQTGQPSQAAGIADAGVAQIQIGQAGEVDQHAGADGIPAVAFIRHVQRFDVFKSGFNALQYAITCGLRGIIAQCFDLIGGGLVPVHRCNQGIPGQILLTAVRTQGVHKRVFPVLGGGDGGGNAHNSLALLGGGDKAAAAAKFA